MFYIRVDANRTIATGHVMRCMAIARQIEALGEPCTFITADDDAGKLIEECGFKVLCLHSKWDALDEETEKLLALIKEKQIKVLLLDSYFVTEDYLQQLGKSTKVVYIDDIQKFTYPVHTIINYGISGNNYHYEEEKIEVQRKYLLGCDYIPLREEFMRKEKDEPMMEYASKATMVPKAEPEQKSETKKKAGKRCLEVLITTGGTDPYNLAGRLIQYLHMEGYYLHVVSGRLNTHLEMLTRLADELERVSVYTDIKNMSELMRRCDAAVSAAGTTLYELCACGTPTVSISFADNQIAGAKELAKRGIIDYAGDLRDDMETCLAKIAEQLYKWDENPALLQKKKGKMQALVDGNGAARIAAYCLSLQREEIR